MPNPNVTIPLFILLVCGIIVWLTHLYHQRHRAEIDAERQRRRNASRPSTQPRERPRAPVLPGGTQSIPIVGDRTLPPMAAPSSPPSYQPPSAPVAATPISPTPSWQTSAPQPGAYQPTSYTPNGVADPTYQPASASPVLDPLAPTPHQPVAFVAPAEPTPAPQKSSDYVGPSEDLEIWLEIYANDVESWVLNHEKILDEVTVHHRSVHDMDPALLATKERLEDRLDHGARTHPSRQQGAELLELLNAGDETVRAARDADFEQAEKSHARYLSYRDIWLPRVQRSLQI